MLLFPSPDHKGIYKDRFPQFPQSCSIFLHTGADFIIHPRLKQVLWPCYKLPFSKTLKLHQWRQVFIGLTFEFHGDALDQAETWPMVFDRHVTHFTWRTALWIWAFLLSNNGCSTLTLICLLLLKLNTDGRFTDGGSQEMGPLDENNSNLASECLQKLVCLV